jgi:hypothetical protein
MNNCLVIGKYNLYYYIQFKGQFSTCKHIIKGSKYEILKFFIDNYNIYNLKKYNKLIQTEKSVNLILNIIKTKNKNKEYSHPFYFANGKYNYINHNFEKMNDTNNNSNLTKNNCFCTIH